MRFNRMPVFFLRLRFATAVLATWLMNLGMFGRRFTLKSACSPGFNCHGCPWAAFACPVGAIAYGSAVRALPVLAIASVLTVAAAVGRLVCGFACPFGLLQDLLHKIPSPKIRLPRWFRYGKYAALLLLVLVLPYLLGFVSTGFLEVSKPVPDKSAGGNLSVKVQVTNRGDRPVVDPTLTIIYRSLETREELTRQTKNFPGIAVQPNQAVDLPPFEIPNRLSEATLVVDSPQSVPTQKTPGHLYFCDLCPNGTLTATIPAIFRADADSSFYAAAAGRWLRLSILAAFLILMVLASRPVCRFFCPLGAMYALASPLALTGMKIQSEACTNCGRCDKVCPMDLDVRKEVGGMECIACGDCKRVCAGKGIHRTFGLKR